MSEKVKSDLGIGSEHENNLIEKIKEKVKVDLK